jgi:hypothetical protein
MKPALTILAMLLVQFNVELIGSGAPSAPAPEPSPKCCCCASGSVCHCGCPAPGRDFAPADSSPDSDRVVVCACDRPVAPLPGTPQTQVEHARTFYKVVAPLSDLTAGQPTIAVRARAHGPPPDLSRIGTFVQQI